MSPQIRFRKPALAGSFLSAVALLFAGCGNGEEAPEARVLPVRTVTVEPQEQFSFERTFLGRVEAEQVSDIGFELGGMVLDVSHDIGDVVAAGAVLARLDTERLLARRAEVEAALEEARAARVLARSTFQRTDEAYAVDSVSAQDLDEARQALAQREAAVNRIIAQLESIDVDLRKSALRAPYEAVIAQRHIDEGQVVAAGQPIFRIQQNERPRVRAGVTREVAEALRVGQELPLSVGGEQRSATVERVAPLLEARARTVDVLLRIQPNGRLLPDGTVTRLRWEEIVEARGFWLPRSALTEGVRGLWACFVAVPSEGEEAPAGATHRLERRPVEWLHESGGRVYIRGPLEPGEHIVADGMHRVGSGQFVKLASDNVADGEGAE